MMRSSSDPREGVKTYDIETLMQMNMARIRINLFGIKI